MRYNALCNNFVVLTLLFFGVLETKASQEGEDYKYSCLELLQRVNFILRKKFKVLPQEPYTPIKAKPEQEATPAQFIKVQDTLTGSEYGIAYYWGNFRNGVLIGTPTSLSLPPHLNHLKEGFTRIVEYYSEQNGVRQPVQLDIWTGVGFNPKTQAPYEWKNEGFVALEFASSSATTDSTLPDGTEWLGTLTPLVYRPVLGAKNKVHEGENVPPWGLLTGIVICRTYQSGILLEVQSQLVQKPYNPDRLIGETVYGNDSKSKRRMPGLESNVNRAINRTTSDKLNVWLGMNLLLRVPEDETDVESIKIWEKTLRLHRTISPERLVNYYREFQATPEYVKEVETLQPREGYLAVAKPKLAPFVHNGPGIELEFRYTAPDNFPRDRAGQESFRNSFLQHFLISGSTFFDQERTIFSDGSALAVHKNPAPQGTLEFSLLPWLTVKKSASPTGGISEPLSQFPPPWDYVDNLKKYMEYYKYEEGSWMTHFPDNGVSRGNFLDVLPATAFFLQLHARVSQAESGVSFIHQRKPFFLIEERGSSLHALNNPEVLNALVKNYLSQIEAASKFPVNGLIPELEIDDVFVSRNGKTNRVFRIKRRLPLLDQFQSDSDMIFASYMVRFLVTDQANRVIDSLEVDVWDHRNQHIQKQLTTFLARNRDPWMGDDDVFKYLPERLISGIKEELRTLSYLESNLRLELQGNRRELWHMQGPRTESLLHTHSGKSPTR